MKKGKKGLSEKKKKHPGIGGGKRQKPPVNHLAVTDGKLYEKEHADQSSQNIHHVIPDWVLLQIEITHYLVSQEVKQHVEHISDERQQQPAPECVEPKFHIICILLINACKVKAFTQD